jgi:hypothetical protein
MSEAPPNARPVAELLAWLAGPAVWAVHFAVMYGAHALICARPGAGAANLWPAVAASATALALLALAGLIVVRMTRARSRARSNGHTIFARDLTIALAAVSMLGVVWVALPAVVTAPCG